MPSIRDFISLTSFLFFLCFQAVVCLPSANDALSPAQKGAQVVKRQQAVTPSPTVVIPQATIIGTTTSLSSSPTGAPVNQYFSIAYAASPIRFASPVSPTPCSTCTVTATARPPACLQENAADGPPALDIFNPETLTSGQSEDCLYLNIFTPSTTTPGGWPVMFWIHGGSMINGWGADQFYDGSAFAQFQNVIVVTINYRLNVFGFPNANNVGNPGLLDQRMAMAWVQNNIRAFGGNKNKVTIFGESAGGWSVDIHLTAYTTNPPFRAAILESSQASVGPPAVQNVTAWYTIAVDAGCPSNATATDFQILSCMRNNVSAATIQGQLGSSNLARGQFISWADGVSQVVNPEAQRNNGNWAQVPTMGGTNADEYRAFVLDDYLTQPTTFNFDTFLTTLAQATNNSVIEGVVNQTEMEWPIGTTPGINTSFDLASKFFTLSVLHCPMGVLLNDTLAQNVSTWRYYFNATFPNEQPLNGSFKDAFDGGMTITIPGGGTTRGALEAYHSTEVPMVFQSFFGGPINPLTKTFTGIYPSNLTATPEQLALSSFMNNAWASFATNPFTTGPGWDALGTNNGTEIGVLGFFGNHGGTGVTLAPFRIIDFNCPLVAPLLPYCGAQGGCLGV